MLGVGGLLHDEWRVFQSDRRTGTPRNAVDGDLIERFLDLSDSDAASVVRLVSDEYLAQHPPSGTGRNEDVLAGGDAPVYSYEEIARRVEDMARLH